MIGLSPAEMDGWRLRVVPRHVSPAQVIHHDGHDMRGRELDTRDTDGGGQEKPHHVQVCP